MRVFVLEDVRVFRDALAQQLTEMPGVDVVGVGGVSQSTLAALEQSSADVTLVNVAERDGVASVREILAAAPEMKVLALGLPETEQEVIEHAEAGIFGYLPREGSLDDLAARLADVGRGEMPISAQVAASLLQRVAALAEGHREEALSALTPREVEIARLLGEGLSNKEIARQLTIELRTVKNHVHNILDKLQVSRRADVARLIARASRLGDGSA